MIFKLKWFALHPFSVHMRTPKNRSSKSSENVGAGGFL